MLFNKLVQVNQIPFAVIFIHLKVISSNRLKISNVESYLLSVLVNEESREAVNAVAVTQGAVGIVTSCAVNMSNDNILVV